MAIRPPTAVRDDPYGFAFGPTPPPRTPEQHPGDYSFLKPIASRFTRVDSPPPVLGAEPRQGLGDYLKGVAHSFDPRTGEGAVNWAGLILGGFGHPEKEVTMPSGFTLKRVAANEPYLSWEGETERNIWSPASRIRRGDRWRPPSQRGVNVTYNVHAPNGEHVGSVSFNVDKNRVFVHEAYVDPGFRKTRAFWDLATPVMNTKLPIEASVTNQRLRDLMNQMRQRGKAVNPRSPG